MQRTKRKRREFADNMLATVTLIVCSSALTIVSQSMAQQIVSAAGIFVGIAFLIRGLLVKRR